MPEPVTITLLTINGLGWLAGTMAGALTGGTTDRAFRNAVKGVRDRLAGLRGVPENHDIAHAVRVAQLQALERVVRDYRSRGRQEWSTQPHTRPELFFERALGFTARAIGRSRSFSTEQNLEVTEQMTTTVDGVLALPAHDGPALERSTAVGALAEDAVLGELHGALEGVSVPEGFEAHFRRGADGCPRFLDLFAAFIGEQIKTNDRFRAIFTSGQLSRLDGLAIETAELVRGIDARFGSALARIESTIDSQATILAEILARVSADKGVPAAPLRAVLERLGEGDVPLEEIATRLAAKAEEYLALREQWSKVADTNPDVTAVRQEAFARLEQGDLDGARAMISGARERLRKAREVAAAEEATLLTDEAQVDLLALRYRDAAARYQEAEALVGFSPEGVTRCRTGRANALLRQGEEFGDHQALLDALAPFRQIVESFPRDVKPLWWAASMCDMAVAVVALGRHERGTARLEEAAGLYRQALEELAADETPHLWASAQNNLAAALVIHWEHTGDVDLLDEAIVALRAALELRNRESEPQVWADSVQNLGRALVAVGEHRSDLDLIREGLACYESAVAARDSQAQPLRWASAMNGLAAARLVLGTALDDESLLTASADGFRAALAVSRRERAPLEWAATNSNLGSALRRLGGLRQDPGILDEALAAFRAALEEATRDRVPLEWTRAQANLGFTLHAKAMITGEIEPLEEAVAACRSALQEMSGGPKHILWASVQYSLGYALALLGERSVSPERFREAATALRASLEGRDRARDSANWALTQFNLGTALRLYAERTGEEAAMTEAIEAYRAALAIPLPDGQSEIRTRAQAALDEVTSRPPAPPAA
jgi:tetratricopeptide (TPR) repeat protein